MNYFDMIGEKLTKTGQNVLQKTKDTTEVLRLNGLISDEQKRMASICEEIGKRYFELHADSCETEFEQAVADLKEASEKIEAYSEQIKKLKHLVVCPRCGKSLPDGASFCTSCGSRVDQQPADQESYCTNCGHPLDPNAPFFCTHCGTKVQSAAPVETKEPTPPTAAAPSVDPAPAQTVCPNCGKSLAPGTAFCTECGYHLGT